MGKKDDDDEDGPAAKSRRGRPPKLFSPLEGRIYAILKGLRRFKNENGDLRVLHFDRLPDKATEKDYYAVIKNPIALDNIKRNYKRKKYSSIDQVVADLDLLFENAKTYNEEGSEVYEDAVELQKQAHILAAQEKAKPDDAFRDEDGKLPLPSIEYKGEVWKVGDWVHINNPNDPRKPIVAQIYRTWQDREGHKWVNACWYYRPEQTVHHYEKHFYENEVAKTGQYRDHRIEEIDDRCFVMFITRYPKGRPRGFPQNKTVYVCEARYNEEKSSFNKIKTWASCLPDEVRDKDYEMDMFPAPLKMKKVPSPIKHLLQIDAKETDDLPKPTWANPNAPPMIGAVHRRPRDANESPPPEPTPPPTAAPLMPQIPMDPRRHSFARGDVSMTGTYQPTQAIPGPSPSPAPFYPQQFAPTPGARPTATATPPMPMPQFAPPPMMPGVAPVIPPSPMAQPVYSPHGYSHQQQFTPQPMPHHAPVPTPIPVPPYNQPPRHIPTPQMMTSSRTPMAPAPNVNSIPHANAQSYPNQYNVPRTQEVYRFMNEDLEAGIPESVREQFQRDDEGRLLWFTAAGRDRSDNNGVAREYAGLGHSVSHLATIDVVREERRRKRKERDEALAAEEAARKKATGGESKEEVEKARERERNELVQRALLGLAKEVERGNKIIEEDLGGWKEEKKKWDEERSAREQGTES
ncbi:hypothetical protein GE09DRAFT_1144321 [Coniochaeta sp. 2T2.1]|nr:hypothetical protein GE09DRAFT_1144321 [Coniochaeta sp. 2T2.1]